MVLKLKNGTVHYIKLYAASVDMKEDRVINQYQVSKLFLGGTIAIRYIYAASLEEAAQQL